MVLRGIWLATITSVILLVPSPAEFPEDTTPTYATDEPEVVQNFQSSPFPWGDSGGAKAPQGEDPTGIMPRHLGIPPMIPEASVVSVGLLSSGAMEIPEDVNTLGWYSPTEIMPGDPGTAVIAGHVDSREQGKGVLFDLRNVDVGAEVIIRGDQRTQTWVVTNVVFYQKSGIPFERIFTLDGVPRLVVITCGGRFDSATRSYDSNVVLYAELVEQI